MPKNKTLQDIINKFFKDDLRRKKKKERKKKKKKKKVKNQTLSK